MTSPAVAVREMTSADLQQVTAIEKVSFAVPWTRSMFEAEIAHGLGWCRVATDQAGTILGYIICRYYGDLWHVMDFAVRPDVRRRGVGARLLDDFLAAVSGTGLDVMLEVRPSNRAAVALYESRGFRATGRRLAYYPDNGEDALVMVLPRETGA